MGRLYGGGDRTDDRCRGAVEPEAKLRVGTRETLANELRVDVMTTGRVGYKARGLEEQNRWEGRQTNYFD